MIDRQLDIRTPDGAMNTFVTHPEEGGPFPVVIFLMDAPGKREELHDMARRLGSAGYYVLLPNLYYRRVREFVADMTEESRKVMFEHMNTLSNAMVCRDFSELLRFADADPAAAPGPVGCVGYCMSGPFVFAAAAAFPERVAAAASMHGVRLYVDAPDSPHLGASRVKGELYFGCAETDVWAPPEMIEKLGAHLAESGARHRIEWYPGTQHGFVFPKRAVYVRDAAERHWERLHALFARNLPRPRPAQASAR
jgi:carboxymethylenebutenolidase